MTFSLCVDRDAIQVNLASSLPCTNDPLGSLNVILWIVVQSQLIYDVAARDLLQQAQGNKQQQQQHQGVSVVELELMQL